MGLDGNGQEAKEKKGIADRRRSVFIADDDGHLGEEIDPNTFEWMDGINRCNADDQTKRTGMDCGWGIS